ASTMAQFKPAGTQLGCLTKLGRQRTDARPGAAGGRHLLLPRRSPSRQRGVHRRAFLLHRPVRTIRIASRSAGIGAELERRRRTHPTGAQNAAPARAVRNKPLTFLLSEPSNSTDIYA